MNTRAFILAVLVAGALTALPSNLALLNLANLLLCMWLWVGGLLAVYFYKVFAKGKGGITTGRGLLLGFVSGLVAAILATILSMITQAATQQSFIRLASQVPALSSALGSILTTIKSSGVYSTFVVVTTFIFYPLFGLVGGWIGGVLFKSDE